MLVNKIQSAQGDSKLSDIKVLNLDGCEATNFEGLSDEFESLRELDLSNNQFQNLKGFPQLKSLDSLNLSNNSIESGLASLVGCNLLRSLDLSNNSISDVAQLEALKNLAHLENIKLTGCPITTNESATYLAEIFTLLPQLKTIDETNRSDLPATNGNNTNGSHAAQQLNGSGDCEEDDEEGDEEDESGLEQLQKEDLEDDDEEYAPEGEVEDDDDEEDDEEDEDLEEEEDDEGDESSDVAHPRGVKRKHDEEAELEAEDSNSAQ